MRFEWDIYCNFPQIAAKLHQVSNMFEVGDPGAASLDDWIFTSEPLRYRGDKSHRNHTEIAASLRLRFLSRARARQKLH